MVREAAFAAAMAAGLIVGQEAVTYSYDVHGRLVQVAHTTGPNAGAQTTYAFDANTNRTSRVTTGASSLLATEAQGARAPAEDDAEPGVAPPGLVHLDPEEPGASDGPAPEGDAQ